MPTTDPGDYQKRALAGRFNHLQKRKTAVTITTINGCNLGTPAGTPVTTPAYPGGFEFWTSETNGVLPASFQTLSRYYKTTQIGCSPTITAVPANGLSPVQNSGDVNNENSVDHAYENGWLTAFFQSIINKGGGTLSCNAMNSIFFTTSGTCTANRMEPIFGALASSTNPDFVVMSQFLNGNAKGLILGANYALPDDLDPGYVVGPGWTWSGTNQAMEVITYKLGTLNNMLLGCLMVQAPNVIDMIQRTNNRIYQEFLDLDSFLAANPSLPNSNFGFAAQYKDFMNSYQNTWNSVPPYAMQLIANIKADLTASLQLSPTLAEWQPLYQLWSNIYVAYGSGNGMAQWQYSINLEWDTTNTKKRDLRKRQSAIGACALPSSASPVSSGQPTSNAASTTAGSPSTAQAGTTTAPAGTTTTAAPVICPNNAVDENPPNCVQPSTSSQPFSCSAGSNLGAATYNPATWCGCNTGTGIYPTMTTGTGNAACAYTSLPSSTINPTIVTAAPSTTAPTSTPFSCTSTDAPSVSGYPYLKQKIYA
ncbi:hypothetical protein MMC28_009321 [Mycoblastus sanguinarius]|nr:hypothetical protein [Mycoblastus sanguinarius]